MDFRAFWLETVPRPTAIGTGLIALDVVLNERRSEEPRLWTGGTCGNVLSIMAYLGWNAVPVSRLGGDPASRLIRRDMRRWGVSLELLSLPPVTNAPVVVHRLRQTPHGEPFHSFSLVCPNCGRRLPAYRPIRQSTASAAVNRLPDPQAVFVDRISPGIITLVKSAANRGAVVVFEPSSIHEKKLFRKMLALTDVLKYSQDRFLDIDPGWLKNVPLVIETLGRGGVRYRSHLNDRNERGWVHLDAFPVSLYRDSAGSGDWCTAGIAHAIARKGALGFKKLTDVRVRAAISFGQALAAWNCSYEGARGGMYTTDRQDFRREVEQVLARKTSFNPKLDQVSPSASRAITAICSECRRKLKSSASGRLYHAV